MDIKFDKTYKSISKLEWLNIPKLAVLTGPNGSGKSQLLELINQSIIFPDNQDSAVITGLNIKKNEVVFLKSAWELNDVGALDISVTIQQQNNLFSNFQNYKNNLMGQNNSIDQLKVTAAFDEILSNLGKDNPSLVTKEEFIEEYSKIFNQNETQLTQKISEVFFNYRIEEIELKAEGLSDKEVLKKLGRKPWDVLREIINQSKLNFEITDPSSHTSFRQPFQLGIRDKSNGQEVRFNDLSSGEKILFSLVFHLYNSNERKLYPKLMLLDEPDAHLHPTMSKQFLDVVEKVLCNQFDVQVIMTTHSPSTVVIAPENSLYEMSRAEPRIKKASSKNHAVSLLTAGIVYVGPGTKYVLVEDQDDVDFYTHVHSQASVEEFVSTDVPLVFIPVSLKPQKGDKGDSGGKTKVESWISKIQTSGLIGVLHGLIDKDQSNNPSKGIFVLNRYSLENYLVDPLIIYATLIYKEKPVKIDDINIEFGQEHLIKSLSANKLQKIVDHMCFQVEEKLKKEITNLSKEELENKVPVELTNGITLIYPSWLFSQKGKVLLNKVFGAFFDNNVINYENLYTVYRRINLFPIDLLKTFEDIKSS